MRSAFILFFIVTIASAYTLEELIEKTLRRSTSLDVIERKIEVLQKDVAVADRFANPTLSFVANTLDANEKMSQSIVSVKQKIYFYGKREAKEAIARRSLEIERARLHKARVALVFALKKEVYAVWKLRRLSAIVDEYIALTNETKRLYESYTASAQEGDSHMGLMSAELSLSELKIKQIRLESLLKESFRRISYIVDEEVDEATIDLTIEQTPQTKYVEDIRTNADYILATKKLDKEKLKIRLANLQKYPDVDIVAGYAYRRNFDDYFNIGFSLSLPIYSTETVLAQKAKAEALQKQAELQDVQRYVLRRIERLNIRKRAYEQIYFVLQNETMPKLTHMLELSASMIQNGMSLFAYLDVLRRKLRLEEEVVAAIANYHIAQAQIQALEGKLR